MTAPPRRKSPRGFQAQPQQSAPDQSARQRQSQQQLQFSSFSSLAHNVLARLDFAAALAPVWYKNANQDLSHKNDHYPNHSTRRILPKGTWVRHKWIVPSGEQTKKDNHPDPETTAWFTGMVLRHQHKWGYDPKGNRVRVLEYQLQWEDGEVGWLELEYDDTTMDATTTTAMEAGSGNCRLLLHPTRAQQFSVLRHILARELMTWEWKDNDEGEPHENDQEECEQQEECEENDGEEALNENATTVMNDDTVPAPKDTAALNDDTLNDDTTTNDVWEEAPHDKAGDETAQNDDTTGTTLASRGAQDEINDDHNHNSTAAAESNADDPSITLPTMTPMTVAAVPSLTMKNAATVTTTTNEVEIETTTTTMEETTAMTRTNTTTTTTTIPHRRRRRRRSSSSQPPTKAPPTKKARRISKTTTKAKPLFPDLFGHPDNQNDNPDEPPTWFCETLPGQSEDDVLNDRVLRLQGGRGRSRIYVSPEYQRKYDRRMRRLYPQLYKRNNGNDNNEPTTTNPTKDKKKDLDSLDFDEYSSDEEEQGPPRDSPAGSKTTNDKN